MADSRFIFNIMRFICSEISNNYNEENTFTVFWICNKYKWESYEYKKSKWCKL